MNTGPTHPSGLPYGDGPESCGTCAWFSEGHCVFSCLPGKEGPLVRANTTNCVFWEPPVECASCGACCREGYDAVPVETDDHLTIQHYPQWIRHHSDGFMDLSRIKNEDGCTSRCVGLTGDGVLSPFRCKIYEHRPTNCRELEAGSENCLI